MRAALPSRPDAAVFTLLDLLLQGLELSERARARVLAAAARHALAEADG